MTSTRSSFGSGMSGSERNSEKSEDGRERRAKSIIVESAQQLHKGARSLVSWAFCRSHFSPKYVWKDNVVGSTRLYVGLMDEHEESWTGLFVDLIYVAMCSKMAHLFIQCEVTASLVFNCFMLMHVFFFSRFFLDEYNIRFELDDIFHRILTFGYVAGICIMLINLNMVQKDSDGYRRLGGTDDSSGRYECSMDVDYFQGFGVGYFVTRLSLIILYVGIMLLDETHRVFYMFFVRIVVWVLALIMMIIAMSMTDPDYIIYPVVAALFFELLGFLSGGIMTKLRKHNMWPYQIGTMYFPVNYLMAQQRIGIYILVVLGESIIMILTPTWSLKPGSNGYVALMFSLLLIFMMAMQYFDQVTKGHGEMHAARRDIIAGMIFYLLHGTLGLCLLCVSVALYSIDQNWESEYFLGDPEKGLLCYGAFVANITMQIMRIYHKGWTFHFSHPRRIAHIVFRLVVASIHAWAMLLDFTPIQSVIFHSLLSTVPVAADIVFRFVKGATEISSRRERRKTLADLSGYKNEHGIPEHIHMAALSKASTAPDHIKRGSIRRMSVSLSSKDAVALALTLSEEIDMSTKSNGFGSNARRRSSGGPISSVSVSTEDTDDNDRLTSVDEHEQHLEGGGDLARHSEDDTMHENDLQARNDMVRRQSDIRASIVKGQDMFEMAEGTSEEEIRENELILLADMELDDDFVTRYREAAEELEASAAETVNQV